MTLGNEVVDMDKRDTVFGPGEGITFGGVDKPLTGGSGGIGVNAFLWRATLDVVSLWPITSADPFGGVIITDWYAPPETPNERFKLNVFILSRALRADGVRVSLFKRILGANGIWREANAAPSTVLKIENAILARAQRFRAASLK